MTDAEPSGAGPAQPTVAGLYDAYLGGTEHTHAEQEAADRLRTAMPEIGATAWANRAFHQRAARWLATDAGLRQFIDLGAGLPTQNNTHQVVQRHAPDAKVVYVDHDAHTVRRGNELVADDPNTTFVRSDLVDVDDVLDHPDLRALIDLAEPVGILATAVFHCITDKQDPWGVAKRYTSRVASGSYLAISHVTADKQRPEAVRTILDIYRRANSPAVFRNREQVEWLFDGLEVVPPYEGAAPKVTFIGYWFCEDPAEADDETSRWVYAGVARKP